MPITRAEKLHILLTSLLDYGPDTPLVIGVGRLDDESAELMCKELTNAEDPLDELLGFDAPDEWDAFGIVTPGRARDLVTGEARERMFAAYMATRDGDTFSHLLSSDGRRTTAEPVGRVPDVCRRVMGLATAPAEHPSIIVWTQIWLDHVLRAVLEADLDGPAPTWEELARLHPAAGGSLSPDALIALAIEHGADQPWAVMRRRCAEATLAVGDISAQAAAWMDDGMFSRWAARQFPPIDEVLDDLAHLCDPMVGDHIGRTAYFTLLGGLGRVA